MSGDEEDYEQHEDWEEDVEEDHEEDAEMEEDEEAPPNPAQLRLKSAMETIFEVFQDPETLTIPVEQMADIMEAIGQPLPDGAATLLDYVEDQENQAITLEGAQTFIAFAGVENTGAAIKAEMYGLLSNVKKALNSLLSGLSASDSHGPARFIIGNPDNAKSGWAVHVDRNPSAVEQYPFEANTSSVFAFTVRVRDAGSEDFLRAMMVQFARIMSAALSAIGNVKLRAETTRQEDDLVRIAFLVDVVESSAAFSVLGDIVELLSTRISAFSFTSQWGASIDSLLTASLDELMCLDMHVTLDTLPISEEYWATLKAILAPNEEMGWSTIEDAYKDLPGLKALLEGNLQATVDCSKLVESQLQKVKGLTGEADAETTPSAGSFLRSVAPLLIMLLCDDSTNIAPELQIDAVSAAVEMSRLVATRDVTEFCRFEWRNRNGFGVRLDCNGIFKLESIYGVIQSALDTVADVAKNMDDEDAENFLENMFGNLSLEAKSPDEEFPDESAFEEE